MKICFLTKTIFNLGGVQRVLTVIASALSKNNEVSIVCTDGKYPINRQLYNLSNEVKVDINPNLLPTNIIYKAFKKSLKDLNRFTGVFNNKILQNLLLDTYYPLKSRKGIIEYFKKNNYDVIIAVEGFYSLWLGIVAKDINAKIIGWQHNSYEAYFNNKYLYYWNQDVLFDRYLKNLDRYVVLNEYDAERFKEEKNIKCNVIYNPRSFTSGIKSTLEKKQFLASGRFNCQKGFDLLIKSFYEFSKKNKDWNLVIVGEGEEKKKIANLISEYKLENRIRLDGFTDNIKNYFLESSVLLLSSRWEGMPMIVLESLEMGVPVISYDITAIAPLVSNNKEGIIVEKFDISKFAEAMNKISDSYEFRINLGRNAVKKSEKFDISNIVKQWEELIADVTN